MEQESALPVDRTAIAIALLAQLDDWLATPADFDRDRVRAAWLALAAPLGGRVRLTQAGKVFIGSVVDVEPGAALVLQLDSGGRRAFVAADTSIAGSASIERIGTA